MRTLALVGLTLALLLTTALVSPWVAWGLEALGWSFPFSRVWNRVLEVLLVVGFVAVWRRLDLGGAVALGLARAGWARELGRGLVLGVVGLGAGLLVGWLGGGLVPALRFDALKTARKAATAALGAVAVGFGEELLFRGVLLRRVQRDAGVVFAVGLTTAIYAMVHALRPGRTALGGPAAGFERLVVLFAPLADATAWPGIAGLAALGVLLAMTRLRSGSLWVPIGIHAAWVGVFRIGRLFLDIGTTPTWLVGPGWPPLVGGVAGWTALGLTTLLLAWTAGGRLPLRTGRRR